MQYLIIRTIRVTIKKQGGEPTIVEDGTMENIVVESSSIADAVAYGILGNVMDGGGSMKLTQHTVLNVIPLEECTKADGKKINQLAQGGGGLTQQDRDKWEPRPIKESQ